ncbi:MAG: DUF120 domain-containing protein, partial [Candidatus Woesearchaeota archaeon]|nr:DUF120 domain-containing protein [Candidatus Woesearchaeota archaeon]
KCYRARIDDVFGAVVIPESSKYERAGISAVEIIAPVFLRKKFFLKDGDNMAFEVYDIQKNA